jgi:hypothetical protein
MQQGNKEHLMKETFWTFKEVVWKKFLAFSDQPVSTYTNHYSLKD